MLIQLIIDKNTFNARFDGINIGSSKIEIIQILENFIIYKVSGSSSYVHRGIGVIYTPSSFCFGKITKIKNHKNDISIFFEELIGKDILVKSNKNEGIASFINKNYPVEEKQLTRRQKEYLAHKEKIENKIII